ncbi:hypothetical protein T440DRAFT_523541 [Plenodomus tracheiphilus IPT5]|uniref:Uncharacterized protein n=1 Tax=Plenodomus tracheiphilus IPT5 TaxID=1408161 RepID=A0A6A7APW2_9PLEO|nr:hypothetical protein T440DRAFT_523541 [Plenodomus tracheiphilus IPT5]
MLKRLEDTCIIHVRKLRDRKEEVDNSREASDIDRDSEEEGRKLPTNLDGYWGTDRIRRVLKEQTSRCMGASLNTKAWRHAYPAIHRKLVKDVKTRDWLNVLYFNKIPDEDDGRARQSGHSARTEEGNYDRSVAESPFQATAERAKFRQEKQAWERWSSLASLDLKPEFKRLAGHPDAEYRGQQEESL